MPVKARTEIEVLGAEESTRRIERLAVAQKNLERLHLAGKVSAEQYGQATRNLAVQQQLLEVGLKNTTSQTRRAIDAMRDIDVQQRRGQQGAQAFGQIFGIGLPRSIEAFLGKSKLIGPVLAAGAGVLTGILAAGILLRYRDEIAQAALSAGGFTEAQRDLYAAAVQANQALLTQFTVLSTGRQLQTETHLQIAALEKERARILSGAESGPEGAAAGQAVGERRVMEIQAEIDTLAERLRQQSEQMTKLLQAQKQVTAGTKEHTAAVKELSAAQQELNAFLGHAEEIDRSLAAAERDLAEVEKRMHAADQKELDDFLRHAETVSQSMEDAAKELEQMERASGKTVDATVADAGRMAEAWESAVQRMAFDLRSFFHDPLRFLRDQFEQFIAEMVASWILGVRRMQGAGAPGAGGPSGGGGILGTLFGGIFGGGGGLSAGIPGMPGTTPPFFPGGTPGTSLSQGLGGSAFETFAGIPGLGSTLSSGGGIGQLGGILPTGSQQGQGLGAALRANLPAIALLGSLQVASAIGFGSPLRGAISGGLIGAGLGFAFGGPFGLLLGALLGGIFGIFGRKKKQKQRDAIEAEAFRAIAQITKGYKFDRTMDAGSAIAQLEQVREQVNAAMKQLKWPSRMDPHINRAIAEIQAIEQQRQAAGIRISGLPTPEFAGGGFIPGAFGRAVPITAHAGEVVLNQMQQRMVGAERIRQAFRSTGARTAQTGGPGGAGFAGGGMVGGEGGGVHIHIHAVDARGVEDFVMRNEGAVVSAARRILRDRGVKVTF